MGAHTGLMHWEVKVVVPSAQAQPPAPALHGSACPETNSWGHKKPRCSSEPVSSSPSSLSELVLPALLRLRRSGGARKTTGSLHQCSTISSYLFAKALGALILIIFCSVKLKSSPLLVALCSLNSSRTFCIPSFTFACLFLKPVLPVSLKSCLLLFESLPVSCHLFNAKAIKMFRVQYPL